MKNFGQSRYEDPEFLRAVNAVNNPFLLDSYFDWKDNARELVSINFLIFGFTVHQLCKKFAKETIFNIWRNEKYLLVLLIYQLFGYYLGKIQLKSL